MYHSSVRMLPKPGMGQMATLCYLLSFPVKLFYIFRKLRLFLKATESTAAVGLEEGIT